MTLKTKDIILGSGGLAAAFALGLATGVIHEKKPMTIAQCDDVAEASYSQMRRRFGYTLTDDQRADFLQIAAYRRSCIDDARAGVRLTLAGL